MNYSKKIYGGLIETPLEKQAFSFGATFGYVDPKTLPEEYIVGQPLEIKNQGTNFTCVAQSLTSASEYQEGVILDPAFTIKVISEMEDPSWVYKGTSLHIGGKAALKGALERTESPLSVEKDGIELVSDPKNWHASYDEIGQKHAKKAWYWIGTSKKLPLFDAIRSALWQFKDEKRAAITGVIWNNEWTYQTWIKEEGTPAGGHAIAVIGWKGDWLIIQNSIGNIGENGLQYFHKDLVNKLFTFNAIMFLDMPDNKETTLEKSQWYRANIFQKFILFIKNFITHFIYD